ncbi:peptidase M20 [Terribacillus saccharophilus]|uniref:Peptidase M20 n=1 Tax=Terribacillus saccharophilus TaxID=361277 RepID=A0A268H9V3_9BACI|nr:M20 family metallopeptidase [Terribacillus saccharophilus]PAE06666.1 peptidase M20 [Terribacillus saccharophilus]
MEQIKQTLAEVHTELEDNFTEVVEWRRYLHQHPELSFQETETARFIADKLRSFGYEDIQTNIGGYGIVAALTGKTAGPTIALRADFDALPIEDEKETAYRSKTPGVMHACGHDGHTAALLGTAKALIKHKDSLKGKVVFLFQPAEEVPPGGAKAMIEDGALDGVDYVYGAHLNSAAPIGKIGVGEGFKMAAVDKFAITIQGKGGHGAAPHEAVDPIVIGSDIVSALQKIVSRRVNPLESAVVTLGVFQSGQAFNVIPDTARLEGTVRTFNADIRQQVRKQIESIVGGIATGFGATYSIDYLHGYPALYNHPEETALLQRLFSEEFGEDQVIPLETGMGAEDFAYYLQEKPGSFFKVGSSNEDTSTHYPHHHPKFDIDEQALLITEKAFTKIVFSLLGS